MLEVLRIVLPDTARQADAAHWLSRRRAPRAWDQAVTGTTRRWLRELPARRRPLRLCAAFPRLANRIAWAWRDTTQSAAVLDDLLVERRGGRRGFPPAVRRELLRLREFNDQHRVESGSEDFWSAAGRVLGVF